MRDFGILAPDGARQEPVKSKAPPLAREAARVSFQLSTGAGAPAAPATLEGQADAAAASVTGAAPGAATAPSSAAGLGLIVDDGVPPGPGQVTRSSFLDQLSPELCSLAETELAKAGRSAAGCPYLAYWLRYYRGRSAAQIERAILQYANPSGRDLAAVRRAIRDRVQTAISTWIATNGRVVQAPSGSDLPGGEGSPQIPASGSAAIQRVAASEPEPSREDPGNVLAQLGPGRALSGPLRDRMQQGFGQDLGAVQLHDDPHSASVATHLQARAFTVGQHIAFAPGEYRPGTLGGEALLAHEIAHTIQQRGAVVPAGGVHHGLEDSADRAATGALLLRPESPGASGGLRLQRCGSAKAPSDLTSLDAKADWIRQTLQGSENHKGRAIADVLMTLSPAEFIDIQSRVDLPAIFGELEDWDAVRIGTLGPVKEPRDKLNRIRADFLYEMTRDRGPAEAQVVAHWMFATMYGDDAAAVLALLAADQHLYNTIDLMPAVLELLPKLGVDRKKYQDRGWKAGDIGSGLKNFGKSILDSSPAAKENKGFHYAYQDMELPQEYRDVMRQVQTAELEGALTPGNIAFGTIDYLAFGIPSSVKGVVTGTVSGVQDIAAGHVEAGTEKLTGSVIFVIGLAFGVRAFRKSARLAALMELTGEGQAGLAALRASIGEAGIDRVARYVKADSKAAFFVREQGLAGVEALHKAAGNVAAARALIPPDVARLGPLLTAETLAGLGLETQQALSKLPDKTLSAMAGVDAATADAVAQLVRETSPAMRTRLAALAESNPAAFNQVLRSQGVAAIEALRTGPFATVEELSGAVSKSAGRVRAPVVKDGVTLYESIDPKNPPAGWKFKDTVTKRGGSVTIRTDVTGPNNASGYFVRRLNVATGELEMLEAYLRAEESGPKVPGSVPGGVEMVPGKGTPTVTYATLRQLRAQGVAMGGLRRIVMRNIENFRSICRLEWMRRNFPGRSLNQLVLDTAFQHSGIRSLEFT